MSFAPLTQERLKELLRYDSETGLFVRLKALRKTSLGPVAGTLSNGYRQLWVDGVLYYAHRLAWLYEHGSFPEDQIDHIDGNRQHNAIRNLRHLANEQNQQNRRKANRSNRSGFLGVTAGFSKNYMAQIHVNRKTIYLGQFDTAEEAHAAYLKAKAKHHPFQTLVKT